MGKLIVLSVFCLFIAWASACEKNSPSNTEETPVSEAGGKTDADEKIDLSNAATAREFESESVKISSASVSRAPDPLMLLVTADTGGNLELNGEDAGTISDTKKVRAMLAETFEIREREGIYKTGDRKNVLARLPAKISKREFEGLSQVFKDAGAESIEVYVLR